MANDSLALFRAVDLEAETEYTYKIRAVDAAGNISGFTPAIKATTLKKVPDPDIDTTPPTVPQNLVATDITKRSALLNWEASTDNLGVLAYKVYGDTTLLATVLQTEFEVGDLLPDTAYSFSVSAIDKADNESPASKVLNFNTKQESDTIERDTVPPTAPADLTALDSTQTTIGFNWAAASDSVGVVGYRIFLDNTAIDTVQETSYEAIGLSVGTDYSFAVSALDAAENESLLSEVLRASTLEEESVAQDTVAPTAPINLTASNITETTVDLQWDAATDSVGVTSYNLFLDDVLLATVGETAYQATNLIAGTTYSFTVSASDAALNESPPGQDLSITTLDVIPPKVDKILVFTKTVEFRHGSIAKGVATLTALGQNNDFEVKQTENSADFNTENLAQYQAVVFLSTTGDVLNDTQQAAFENYIRSGGSYMGIHAASDTEYDWPWYGALVGGYFNGHPEIQEARIDVLDNKHPSTTHLQDSWTRTDEWYNFRDIQAGINPLLNLDESTYTGGTNGSAHPIAWYREFDGGRSFYTGGGHSDAAFDEPDFREHLLGGILYCLERDVP